MSSIRDYIQNTTEVKVNRYTSEVTSGTVYNVYNYICKLQSKGSNESVTSYYDVWLSTIVNLVENKVIDWYTAVTDCNNLYKLLENRSRCESIHNSRSDNMEGYLENMTTVELFQGTSEYIDCYGYTFPLNNPLDKEDLLQFINRLSESMRTRLLSAMDTEHYIRHDDTHAELVRRIKSYPTLTA